MATTTPTATASGAFTCADPPGIDVSASLNACLALVPMGATWDGGGKTYMVDEGITVPHTMALTNATFVDHAALANLAGLHMPPIITVQRVDGVVLSDLNIYGKHSTGGTAGRYQASQAGIRLRSANNVTITRVQTFDTWGDGLEATANSSVARLDNRPVTNLLVRGFTSTRAGRDCLTGGEVFNSVLDHVTCIENGRAAINFETDSPNSGSGNVTISNCSSGSIHFLEYLYGPMTVENCTGLHDLMIASGHTAMPLTITIADTTMTCQRRSPVPCILQTSGHVVLRHDTIGRKPGPSVVTDSALWVTRGGTMSVQGSIVSPIVGGADSSSTLTFTP